jgi:hypothetical protein
LRKFAVGSVPKNYKRFQNNRESSTPVRDIHTAFNRPYVYDYVIKLCRKQAEVVRNLENEHIRGIGEVKPDIENIRGLNLAVVKLMTFQMTRQPLAA